MSQQQERKIGLRTFILNQTDEREVLLEYIEKNFKRGKSFSTRDIQLWDNVETKILRNLWSLVYKGHIDLYEGSAYPLLFRRKVKYAKKNQDRLREADDSGIPDSG